MKLGFSQQTFKLYSSIMKICPVEAELFHADRRTGMMKATIAFRNFVNAPKNEETITGRIHTTHAHAHTRAHAHTPKGGSGSSIKSLLS